MWRVPASMVVELSSTGHSLLSLRARRDQLMGLHKELLDAVDKQLGKRTTSRSTYTADGLLIAANLVLDQLDEIARLLDIADREGVQIR